MPIFRTKKDWLTVRNPLQLVDKSASDLLLTWHHLPIGPQHLSHHNDCYTDLSAFFFTQPPKDTPPAQLPWNQMWLQKGTCHSAMSRSSWCLIQYSSITQLHKFSPAFSRSIPTLHKKKNKNRLLDVHLKICPDVPWDVTPWPAHIVCQIHPHLCSNFQCPTLM